ncbi:MAG: metallophosphoesterase [Clostridia bacterium]|nr:metallophosphoesterase [Clostridia bacterium]
MKQMFETTQITVRSNKIASPIKIVQISDLHDALYGEAQIGLRDAIQAQSPDWIAVTGDLFNRKKPKACRNAFALIEAAVKIAPVYVVEGNHEVALGEIGEQYLSETERRGAAVLRDERTALLGLNVIGLRQRAERDTLRAMIDPERFNLVLCHRPELFSTYAGVGADLILCGHAHGGQVRIGQRAIYAPQQGMFPRYTSGLYEAEGTRMFVSRGLGDTVIWPRIRNPHELNVIELLPDSES